MAKFTINAVLLIAFSFGYQQLVRSKTIHDSLAELDRKVTNLDANFKEIIEEQFYRPRNYIGRFHEPWQVERYAFLKSFVEIAKIELSQYKRERRALLVAKNSIEKYLSNTTSETDSDHEVPMTKCLTDYIISRSILRAYDDDIGQHESRKKICIFAETYHTTNYLKAQARNYYIRLEDREALERRTWDNVYDALKTLRSVSDNMLKSDKSNSIEALILNIDSEYEVNDDPELMRTPIWIGQVILDIALTDIEATRRARVSKFQLDELDKMVIGLTMDHVHGFEESVVLSPMEHRIYHPRPTSRDLLLQMDWLQRVLSYDFDLLIAADFDDIPSRISREHGTYHARALSALLAKSYGLIYAVEKTMLRIMQKTILQYFVDGSKHLSTSLIENSNLIELIYQRSTQHAIETGLLRTLDIRKRIFLLLKKYEQQTYLRQLSDRFYQHIQMKKNKYAEAAEIGSQLLRKYNNDVLLVLSDTEVQNTLAAVDEIINKAIEHDGSRMLLKVGNVTEEDLGYFLRQNVGERVLHKIVERDEEMKSKGYQWSQSDVDSIAIKEVSGFEASQAQPTAPSKKLLQ